MARLRYNDVSGTAAGNPVSLTAGGTTATWSSAPAFPTIAAPDFAAITVEPDTVNEEIIHLTAYTAAALTGTVVRNAEATQGGQNSTAAHTAVAWNHGPVVNDYVPGVGNSANDGKLVGYDSAQASGLAPIASYVPQTGAGSPYGTVTPSAAGNTYTDTNTGDLWVASTTSNTSWRLNPGPAKRTWMRTAFR